MDRYDEALAKARSGKSLEEIFPEMNESEDERDERIRKAIVHLLTVASESYLIDATGFKKEQFLSYLEKQKEQKEIPLMNGDADLYFDNWIQHNDTTKRGYFEEGIRYAQRLQKEQKLNLTAKGKGVYKICPHCKSRMIRDDSKVYTSIPPQYGYNCPKCGTMEFDTVMYDNPEMEEQIIDSAPLYTIEQVDEKIREAQEWSEDNIKELTEFEAAMLHIGMSFFGGSAGLNPNNTNEVKKQAKLLLELVPKQEWSEEDRNMLNGILLHFNASFRDMNEKEKLCFNWLQSLLERFNLQPKQEWSEEDERHLIWLCRIIHSRVVNKELSLAEESKLGKWIDKWINHGPQPVQKWDEFDEDCLKRAIWYVENPAPSVVKDTNLVLWLNSLRPQSKQDVLPSLSEKEIICLKRALDYLRKEHNRYGGEDFTNEIAVLEWLITHPIHVSDTHWKPSEEQMEALRVTLEYMPDTFKPRCTLMTLQNDLEKLM